MIGTTVSHYRILEKLGAGGMGEVYLAEDTKLDRKVALKFLPAAVEADAEARERLIREAKATSRLSHPNILTVHTVDEHEGRHFIVMEYVPGTHLGEYARQRELATGEILNLVAPVVEGLAKAHQAGIVHRDLKPSNILVDEDGRPRVLDFGLAKIEGAARITQTGSTVGTIAYSSPEQLLGKVLDERSDIFSIGVILYELIAHRLPFDGEHEAAISYAITHDQPEPLARYKANMPAVLEQIVTKCLSKDPGERYQTCADLLADLRREIRLTSSTGPVMTGAPPRAENPKRKVIWTGSLVVIAALIALAVIQPWTSDDPAIGRSTSGLTLAVLPFINQGSPEDEYFADGVTEQITTHLAKIHGLRVIARASAMLYKGSELSLTEIAAQLGVNYLLVGTVRWDKSTGTGRVRISPELTQAEEGFRIWGDSYDRRLTQIFDVQAEIADQIATALGVSLVRAQREQLAYRPTENMRAYDYFLRARDRLNSGTEVRPLRDAMELLHKAIAEDPDFLVAHALLARTHTLMYWHHHDPRELDSVQRIIDYVLEHDPMLPELQLTLGTYYTLAETSYERATVAFDNARLALGESSDLYQHTSYLALRMGDWSRAIADANLALELDPRSATKRRDLAKIYDRLHDYESATQLLDRANSVAPPTGQNFFTMIRIVLNQYGSVDSARRIVEEASSYMDPVLAMSSEGGSGMQLLGHWRFGLLSEEPDSLMTRLEYLYAGPKPYTYHVSRAEIARTQGRMALSRAYLDTALALINARAEKYSDDFHFVQSQALVYSMIGNHEQAVQVGLRAKELMPIDLCHW